MTVTVWSYHGHNVCRSDFPGCKDRIASFDVLTGKLRPLYLRNYLADFFCIGLNIKACTYTAISYSGLDVHSRHTRFLGIVDRIPGATWLAVIYGNYSGRPINHPFISLLIRVFRIAVADIVYLVSLV